MNSEKSLLLSQSNDHKGVRMTRDKLRCGGHYFKFTSGCFFILIIFFSTISVHCYLPDKYPIEVYHMLKERITDYGFGKDNRVKGNWAPWSSWSQCSRSCGTGVQSQQRHCITRDTIRKRSIISEVNITSLKPVCIGTYKRYHICNTQECPDYYIEFRAEQCAKYNGRMYKGKIYTWIPFLNAPNPCALNCRAVGERFYATLEPQVVDGTPCDGPNLRGKSMGGGLIIGDEKMEQWICVSGQCKSVGCDGVVGSGVIKDTCGVCGGQGRGCKLFEGIFMEPILSKGHQPVTTIPQGAMSLNISELRYSSNLLALKLENGSYILNGPWSVSPSGSYKIAGTTVSYQRGDKYRMECITATGPLNVSLNLEILYHEINPGVFYKYMLPSSEINQEDNSINSSSPPLLYLPPIEMPTIHHVKKNINIHDNQRDKDDDNKNQIKFSPTTVMAGDAPTINNKSPKIKKKKKRKFSWKVLGFSPCTKTCGGGIQNIIIKCMRDDNGNLVPDRRCKRLEKPQSGLPLKCNVRPCPPKWRGEDWSECSVTCGTGVKTRRLECVQDLNEKMTMRVAAGACPQPPDLNTVKNCTAPRHCPLKTQIRQLTNHYNDSMKVWQIGPWTPCSSSCGKGIKMRRITCKSLDNNCPESTKPISEKPCETVCSLNLPGNDSQWLYTQWFSKCSIECGHEMETRQVACSNENELLCDIKHKPATSRSCSSNSNEIKHLNCNSPKWFTGPWSTCSVKCGEGIIRRQVICIDNSSGKSKILFESNCSSLRPPTEKTCSMPSCSSQWFTSDWNMCSVSCGPGIQQRIVRCLLDGDDNTTCNEKTKPPDKRSCNDRSCNESIPNHLNQINSTNDCVDKYPNCELVIKAGLCRIKYYQHSCCACSHN